MGKIHGGARGLSPVKALREESSDPAREQGHSSRTRVGQEAWAASLEQPGQRRTAQTAKIPALCRFSQRQLKHLLSESFESGKSSDPLPKAHWLAPWCIKKFAACSLNVSKVCCFLLWCIKSLLLLNVSTTCAINNFQQDGSFSKIKQFLKFLLKVTSYFNFQTLNIPLILLVHKSPWFSCLESEQLQEVCSTRPFSQV